MSTPNAASSIMAKSRRSAMPIKEDVGWVQSYRIFLVVEKNLSWILEFLNEALTILLPQAWDSMTTFLTEVVLAGGQI